MAAYTSPLSRITKGKKFLKPPPEPEYLESGFPELSLPIGAGQPGPVTSNGRLAIPDVSIQAQDVPLPAPIRGEEEPEKVGFGRKLARGFQRLIPYIGELAQGAAEGGRETSFLGGLGRAYGRSQERPFERMAAEGEYLKGRAEYENILAQAEQRRAEAEQARTETAGTAEQMDVQNQLARARAVAQRARARASDISARLKATMTKAQLADFGLEREIKELELVKQELRGKHELKFINAELDNLESLKEQRGASARRQDVQAEQAPLRTAISQRRNEIAQQSNELKEAQLDYMMGKSDRADFQLKISQHKSNLEQSYRKNLLALQKVAWLADDEEEANLAIKDLQDDYIKQIQEVDKIEKGILRDEGGLPGGNTGPSRESIDVRGYGSVLPGANPLGATRRTPEEEEIRRLMRPGQ